MKRSCRGVIPIIHGAAADRPDEADTLAAAEAVRASLMRSGYAARIVPLGLDLTLLEHVAAERPLLVFNLVEALDGDAALARLVPPVLERLALAYTGAHAHAWRDTVSKMTQKRLMAGHGLSTPAWSPSGHFAQGTGPVIVKSATEHGSLGIDQQSVVPAAAAAREIAAREQRFGGRFFAEEFIAGREFNMGVYGTRNAPRLLPASEIVFSGYRDGRAAIVDYDAKWHEASEAYRGATRRVSFGDADAPLLEKLGALSLAAWHAFALNGYARVDFRVDHAGRPSILEINVNPCLTPDAGFYAAAARAGLSYDAMIESILDAALHSQRQTA